MKKNILIVDSDENFSTILKEGLNNHPTFDVISVRMGEDAVRYLADHDEVDLVIIDMGIIDAEPALLVEAARELRSGINIMMIPLIGQQDVPDDVKKYGLQGVLPKPFFVGTLPKVVGQAVGLDLEEEIPDLPLKSKKSRPKPKPKPKLETPKQSPSETAASSQNKAATDTKATDKTAAIPVLSSTKLDTLRENEDEIIEKLKDLNNEVRADVTLLTAGTELIAKAGNMAEDRAYDLATLVAECAVTASQAASFLGERDKKFEQTLYEGNQYKLYIYNLGEGVLLTVALGARVAIGMLRHRSKEASQELMKYIN